MTECFLRFAQISIHALREEGDSTTEKHRCGLENFYPRPPRGGRPLLCYLLNPGVQFLSTPSARRATVLIQLVHVDICEFLSTPSARRATTGEGEMFEQTRDFYPRPPRGGRLTALFSSSRFPEFLSTPSARRATNWRRNSAAVSGISIHALREEGDFQTLMLSCYFDSISIHALREEGDPSAWRSGM